MKPMRMLIMLMVLWATGSLLFAADAPPVAPAQPVQNAGDTTGTAPAPQPSEAAEESATEGATKAEAGEPAPEAAAESAGAAAESAATGDEDPNPPSAGASDADRAASPQRFVPSEQVRADFDVSFPIDI